jgi:hypothetical protein
MKSLPIALIMMAALATAMPAAAQMKGGKKGHSEDTTQPKKKVDEKGYKSALDRIPDQKFDPWSKVR